MKCSKIIGIAALMALSANTWANLTEVNSATSHAIAADRGLDVSTRSQRLLNAVHIKNHRSNVTSEVATDKRIEATSFSPADSTVLAVDRNTANSAPLLTDPLLMFLALIGLIVLQLRRKQKTLPHRSLASVSYEIDAPAVKTAKLELTLQS